MSTFEFNNQLVPQSLIEVENIGKFAIEASNDEGLYWYMIISTSLGQVTMVEWGPVIPDLNEIPEGFSNSLTKMEYKEPKIEKMINFWLNDKYKKLTDAKIITIGEALDVFPDLRTYLQTILGEVSLNENQE